MAVTLLDMWRVQPRGMCCHDDLGTARAVRLILERCGFDLAPDTRTAAEAVVAAAVVRPDVVVLDLDLSGTLGVGVVAALHDVSSGSKVVVLSSFDTMRAAVLAAGAHEFVLSVDLRDLENALSALAQVWASEHPAPSTPSTPSTPAGPAGVGAVAADEAQEVHEVRAASSPVTPAANGRCRTKAPSS